MEIKKAFGKIKLREVIYPAITVLFFLGLIIFFVSDVRFITKNINKVFYVPDPSEIESRMLKVDLENYYIVAKRLGISTASSEVQMEQVQPVVPQEQTSTSLAPEQPQEPMENIPEKSSFKISVFNTTATKGLAAAVKKDLEAAGFTVAETGNQTPTLEATQIKIKSGVNDDAIINELVQVVSRKYPSAVTVPDDTIAVDVVVLIGNQQ